MKVTQQRLDVLSKAVHALGDMIDLSDAWATSGPEGYTREERKRRATAEKTLSRLTRLERKFAEEISR